MIKLLLALALIINISHATEDTKVIVDKKKNLELKIEKIQKEFKKLEKDLKEENISLNKLLIEKEKNLDILRKSIEINNNNIHENYNILTIYIIIIGFVLTAVAMAAGWWNKNQLKTARDSLDELIEKAQKHDLLSRGESIVTIQNLKKAEKDLFIENKSLALTYKNNYDKMIENFDNLEIEVTNKKKELSDLIDEMKNSKDEKNDKRTEDIDLAIRKYLEINICQLVKKCNDDEWE